MAEKNSFILYLEYAEVLKDTTDEQFGRLMRHLFAHASGADVSPEADVAIAYRFIVNQMDRDAEKYDEKIEGRRKAGAAGGKKRAENAKNEQENQNIYENSKQEQANEANATFASDFQANQANATFACDVQANPSKSKQSQASSSKVKQIQANPSKVKQSQANQADNDKDKETVTVTVDGNVNAYVSETVTETVDVERAQHAQPVEKSVEKSESVEKEKLNFVFDGQSVYNTDNMPAFWIVKKYCDENHPNVNAQDFYDYYKAQGWCCNGKPIKSWKSLLSSWAKHQREKPQEQAASYDLDAFVQAAMSKSLEQL